MENAERASCVVVYPFDMWGALRGIVVRGRMPIYVGITERQAHRVGMKRAAGHGHGQVYFRFYCLSVPVMWSEEGVFGAPLLMMEL